MAVTRCRVGGDLDLVVLNAKVYTMDAAAPRAEAFAVKNSRFVAIGSSAEMKALAGEEHADVRREADDGRAWLHRLPQPRGRRRCSTRCSSAIRLRSSSSQSRASSRSSARRHKRRRLGRGSRGTSRRHEAERQAAARPPRSRPGVDRASGGRAPSRRPHVVLQQQGARAGGITKDTPNPAGGTFDRDATGELTDA